MQRQQPYKEHSSTSTSSSANERSLIPCLPKASEYAKLLVLQDTHKSYVTILSDFMALILLSGKAIAEVMLTGPLADSEDKDSVLWDGFTYVFLFAGLSYIMYKLLDYNLFKNSSFTKSNTQLSQEQVLKANLELEESNNSVKWLTAVPTILTLHIAPLASYTCENSALALPLTIFTTCAMMHSIINIISYASIGYTATHQQRQLQNLLKGEGWDLQSIKTQWKACDLYSIADNNSWGMTRFKLKLSGNRDQRARHQYYFKDYINAFLSINEEVAKWQILCRNNRVLVIKASHTISEKDLIWFKEKLTKQIQHYQKKRDNKAAKLNQLEFLGKQFNMENAFWLYIPCFNKEQLPTFDYILNIEEIPFKLKSSFCSFLKEVYGSDNVVEDTDNDLLRVIGHEVPKQSKVAMHINKYRKNHNKNNNTNYTDKNQQNDNQYSYYQVKKISSHGIKTDNQKSSISTYAKEDSKNERKIEKLPEQIIYNNTAWHKLRKSFNNYASINPKVKEQVSKFSGALFSQFKIVIENGNLIGAGARGKNKAHTVGITTCCHLVKGNVYTYKTKLENGYRLFGHVTPNITVDNKRVNLIEFDHFPNKTAH